MATDRNGSAPEAQNKRGGASVRMLLPFITKLVRRPTLRMPFSAMVESHIRLLRACISSMF